MASSKSLLSVLAVATLAAACSNSSDNSSKQALSSDAGDAPCVAAADGAVTVDGAWVRAVPSGEGMSAAFFDICNGSDAPKALTSVSTPAAGAVELHTTSRGEDGVVGMQQIETLIVASGARAALAPGGDHVMLMQLTGPIADGASVPLTLTFDDGSTISLTADAKNPADAATMDHNGH